MIGIQIVLQDKQVFGSSIFLRWSWAVFQTSNFDSMLKGPNFIKSRECANQNFDVFQRFSTRYSTKKPENFCLYCCKKGCPNGKTLFSYETTLLSFCETHLVSKCKQCWVHAWRCCYSNEQWVKMLHFSFFWHEEGTKPWFCISLPWSEGFHTEMICKELEWRWSGCTFDLLIWVLWRGSECKWLQYLVMTEAGWVSRE